MLWGVLVVYCDICANSCVLNVAEVWHMPSFQWINSRTVVLLDSVEKLHVIDRQTQEELETVEISEVQLVYNSSHFKSLATGGNVSQALVKTYESCSLLVFHLSI